jgi:hypothetical protein
MEKIEISANEVSQRIFTLRGCRVMLDSDLADIYEVETKRLKEAVRRNIERFPGDFMFESSKEEFENLRTQFASSSCGKSFTPDTTPNLRSQFASSSSETDFRTHGGDRYAPFLFTELGVAMLSSVLNSKRAIQINIEIMRVFVQLRTQAGVHESHRGQNQEKFDDRFAAIEQRLDRLERKPQIQPTLAPRLRENSDVQHIQDVVARHWGVTTEDLQSPDRSQAVTLPRQIAIYLIRKHLHIAFAEIGRHFGGRDHTTILYAFEKIQSAIEGNKMIRAALSSIQSEISIVTAH